MMELARRVGLTLLSLLVLFIGVTWIGLSIVNAQVNEDCTISVLNRSGRVAEDGKWLLNNVPTTFGPVRARATCAEPTGTTLSGQTSYVSLQPDRSNGFDADIVLGVVDPIPRFLTLSAPVTSLGVIGATAQVSVIGTFADDSTGDLTNPTTGTSYTVSNPAIATIDANGIVTAVSSGRFIVSAMNDGVVGAIELQVALSGEDTDGDGMSDEYEVRFGLNPNDPSDAGLDPDGDGLTNLQESQLGSDPFNPDITPPAVSQVDPADGATGFPLNHVIIVRFTEPMSEESIVDGVVRLFQGVSEIPGTLALSDDALSLTFRPSVQLTALTPYSLTVQDVRDVAGNLLPQPFTSSFTTGSTVDFSPPSVVRTTVSGLQPPVISVNAPFRIEFSEKIDPSTLTASNVIITDGTAGQAVAGMFQVDPDNKTASFVPERPWGVNRGHTILLTFGVLDAGGNALGFSFASFTSSFESDSAPPVLLGAVPSQGEGNVTTNTVLMWQFDEPIDFVSTPESVEVLAGSLPVAGSIALSDGNRRVVFTPAAPLAASTTYTAMLGEQIKDLAGNMLPASSTVSFTTGTATDTTKPTFLTSSPPRNNGSVTNVIVGTNVVLRAEFSEPLNPLTVTDTTLEILETVCPPVSGSCSEVPVESVVTLSADGRVATITPVQPLNPSTAYQGRAFAGIADRTGNLMTVFSSGFFLTRFQTAEGQDLDAPTVTSVSPPDGSTEVPVNTQVVAVISEAFDSLSLGFDAIQISDGAGPVAGAISFHTDQQTPGFQAAPNHYVAFAPAAALSPSTTYSVSVSGFSDRVGNLVVPFASTFTTSASTTPDAAGPTVSSVTPPNASTDVPVSSAIAVDFDEPIDAASVSSESMPITVDGVSGVFPGTYATAGTTVTFTPAAPFPGLARVRVNVEGGDVRDYAGNGGAAFSSFFDTAAQIDNTPPLVTMVTPADGATDVGPSARVVLNFSEPINPSTVNNDNFNMIEAGQPFVLSVERSADNKTVFMNTGRRRNGPVTVVVTQDVEDLSGNALAAEFQSQFTFSDQDDRLRVSGQRPGSGAEGVRPDTDVYLYLSEAIDPASLGGALFVSENGVVVSGTTSLANGGHTLRFTPDAPFDQDALVQVALTTDARDLSGTRAFAHQGLFRTEIDPQAAPPAAVATSPFTDDVDVPLNPAVEFLFSEPLDPAGVDGTTAILRQVAAGLPEVPSTVSLVRGGTAIRITPNSALLPGTTYNAQIDPGVRDLDGVSIGLSVENQFTTGSLSDTQNPVVVLVSPPGGTAAAAVNARIRVRFDTAINPISVTDSTIQISDGSSSAVACSISFTNGGRDVVITPHAPLAGAALHTITISGVEDLAGNAVPPTSVQFTTGAEPDTTSPITLLVSPSTNDPAVPVNGVLAVEVNEALDPGSANQDNFTLETDAFPVTQVPASFTVSTDGRLVTLVPNTNLAPGSDYFALFQDMTDLAGNRLGPPNSLSFTTSTDPDNVAPQFARASPGDGYTAVPTNSRIFVGFTEPVQPPLGGITLTGPTGNIDVARVLEDGNTAVRLVPLAPLDPNASYTIQIAGVADVAGNALSAATTTTFTTASGVDLVNGTVSVTNLTDGETNVSVGLAINFQFSERASPFGISTPLQLSRLDNGLRMEGSFAVAADGLSATFTPDQPLAANTQYRLQVFGATLDLAGNPLSPGFNNTLTFTTAP